MKNDLQPSACIPYFVLDKRGDLIETYKIINKVNDVHVGFTLSNNSRTRGHP